MGSRPFKSFSELFNEPFNGSFRLDDIVDNNKGSFFDALRAWGFRLFGGDEYKGIYVLGDYKFFYQRENNYIYDIKFIDLGKLDLEFTNLMLKSDKQRALDKLLDF